MAKLITVFADADLDGAGCVTALKWLYTGHIINHKAVNERTFEDTFRNFLQSEEYGKNDIIYICDLNVAEKHSKLIDDKKVVYIDHHNEPLSVSFTSAALVREASPSCASLVWKCEKSKSSAILSNAQKLLLALIDDYDSYTLKAPQSLQLNTVFYSLQGDRIQQFWDKFKNGFTGFNDHQKNVIHFHTLKVNQIFNELQVYRANIPLEGKTYNIVSTFAEYAINEVASHILKKYNSEIAVVINPKTNTVSFRKQKGVNYDVSYLAKKLAEGDGNSNAAGGKLTSAMLTFSKVFKPL